jgi:transposase
LNPRYAANVSAEERRRRLERFQRLAQFIQEGGQSWVTSVPGARIMRVEATPNISSALAGKLTKLGYQVAICAPTTRIAPAAITESFKDAAGRPVVRHHVGIINVDVLEVKL